MPFSLEALADAPPPVVRFGGRPVPTRPFASALVEDPERADVVVGDVAPMVSRQAGIADTSEGARRTEAIGRVPMAAQEDVFASDPESAARNLAGIHWGIEQDTSTPARIAWLPRWAFSRSRDARPLSLTP